MPTKLLMRGNATKVSYYNLFLPLVHVAARLIGCHSKGLATSRAKVLAAAAAASALTVSSHVRPEPRSNALLCFSILT